jgi:hypothetical protein
MYVIGLARLTLRTPCRRKADKYVDVRPRILHPKRLLPEEWGDYKSDARIGASLEKGAKHEKLTRSSGL